MSGPRHRQVRRVSLTTVIALVLTTAVSTAVIAAHRFNDVPNSNQFHGSISWMADNGVTQGCDPDNNLFCPSDNVTRQQMAAFMRRFAQTFGTVGDQVVDTSDNISINSSSGIAVASVQVAPKSQANVVLNAHVTFAGGAPNHASGFYEVRRGNCGGSVVASGRWDDWSGLNVSNTFALTGVDVVSSTTTYSLCVGRDAENAEVRQRALTATWSPTS
jgi:hypothetical protein